VEKGFTLIELVVVIVILGIVTAFAVPRYANLSTTAKISTIQNIQGSMKSSAFIVHSLATLQNVPYTGPDAGRAITTQFGLVDTWNRYPESRAETGSGLGMLELIQLNVGQGMLTYVDNDLVRIGYDLTVGSNGCYAEYLEATSATNPPAQTIQLGGC
jgi:MSHA pilin protein MshA